MHTLHQASSFRQISNPQRDLPGRHFKLVRPLGHSTRLLFLSFIALPIIVYNQINWSNYKLLVFFIRPQAL